jgi:hypothetical protein
MPRWSDLPEEFKKRFRPPPERSDFESDDEYGDAVSYWQQTVGRNIGFALQRLKVNEEGPAAAVEEKGPESPPK